MGNMDGGGLGLSVGGMAGDWLGIRADCGVWSRLGVNGLGCGVVGW